MQATPASSSQEEMQSSETPYSAQPTPSATTKMPSTLPPIAVAQPLGNISQIQTHLPGGSNIPVNPNAPAPIYNPGTNVDPNRPLVTVMAMAPTGVTGDAEADNMRFAFLQKCRWLAGFMLAYYLATFLFLQPFILGTCGLLTGFLGYYGSRPPVDAQRLKWLRWYIWANYAMLVFNMWLLIIALLFSGRMVSYSNGSDSDSGSDYYDEYETYYYSSNTGLFVGLLVAANTIVHLRCMRMAQLLVAELMAAGVDRQIGPVVMLAPTNPTTAV